MRSCRLYLVLLFLCCCSLAKAQDNYKYTSYGVDDGLPQSSVLNIVQDKQGFLWVGTSDGICRFDGYKFTIYRGSAGDSNILVGGLYNKFYYDKSNELWVVSQNGIGYYDKVKDKFVTVFYYQKNFSNNYNSIVGEDDKNIIAVLCGYGILKIDKRSRYVRVIRNETTTSIATCINAVFCNNEIWMTGGNLGSYVYNMGTGALLKLKSPHITALINYNDSQLLAASQEGVVLLNKKDKSEQSFPILFGRKLVENVTGILPLSSSEVMFTSAVGVYYVDPRNWTITKHIRSFTPGEQNSFAYAQCIYKDRSGNIWIGTNGDGLKMLMAPYKKFKYYSSHNPKGTLVKSIYADSKNVYVGYYGTGLDIFDRKAGLLRSVSMNHGAFNSDHVMAITSPDSSDLLMQLVGTNSLALYSLANGTSRDLSPLFRKISSQYSLGNSYPFFLKTGNTIYANVSENCLVSFNTDSADRIDPLLVKNMGEEKLICGYKENNGTLWVGTLNGAFYIKDDSCYRLNLPELVTVKSINQDMDGNIWLGTVKGIYIIDTLKKVKAHYSESNGLSNQFIYGLLRDDSGNMWFSHNKGLSVYSKTKKSFRHYTKDDGLQSNEFNTGAFFKSADGELFFGGIAGTNSFYPAEVRDNPNAPVTVITNVKLFDVPLKTDSAYWNLHELSLAYNQNSLSFEFAALEYTNPKNNRYAYMMEGLDNNWINVGDERFARYVNLPPGKYIFKVKAANNDGVWQEVPTTIAITIVPPFWQRLWFRICFVLFFISCVAGVVLWVQALQNRRRIRALELQQKIQLERERISRDLHDTVGTQLSLISNNIEWVTRPLKEITETEKTDKLQFVNETARDIIATLRETIWALNKQQIQLEEFADKLNAFVRKQVAIYPELQLNFNDRISEVIILGPSEALNLFRICQEAIANSLKYAEATVIDITIQNVADKYRVSITDNGKGFDINAVDATVHNGIENMKYRAGDINCNLELHSAPGKGTSILIVKK